MVSRAAPSLPSLVASADRNRICFALGGGGIAHGDPGVRGLRGVSIQGFDCNGVVALTDFYGTKANKTNVRGIKVFGNSVTNGILIRPAMANVKMPILDLTTPMRIPTIRVPRSI
jgi:hypothetical protein